MQQYDYPQPTLPAFVDLTPSFNLSAAFVPQAYRYCFGGKVSIFIDHRRRIHDSTFFFVPNDREHLFLCYILFWTEVPFRHVEVGTQFFVFSYKKGVDIGF
jgi:hypothetical protein